MPSRHESRPIAAGQPPRGRVPPSLRRSVSAVFYSQFERCEWIAAARLGRRAGLPQNQFVERARAQNFAPAIARRGPPRRSAGRSRWRLPGSAWHAKLVRTRSGRKSVVLGKRVSVSLDLGGRGDIKKQKK